MSLPTRIKSWRTTILGLAAALIQFLEIVVAILDPEQSGMAALQNVDNLQGIGLGLAVAGLGLVSRDDVVSSEGTLAQKAKRPPVVG